MLITQQIKQFRALNKWFQTPLGLAVVQEFNDNLNSVIDNLKGELLLQLGNCNDNLWFNKLKYDRKWIASPFSINSFNHLECSLSQLPLPRNSVDCIVAPLTLEPFGSSYALLDEIDRVLKPMGYIVILSINPWSFWGGAMKCGLLDCYDDSNIKMRSPINLNRTFLQRGYRQCSLSNICYIPPFNNQAIINKLAFLDEVGKMIWPYPSGFYCYVAQKYEYIHPSLIVSSAVQTIPAGLQPAIN